MKIIDFLLKKCGGDIERDECGNVYLYNFFCIGIEPPKDFIEIDMNDYFIPKEVYEKYSAIEIVITGDDSVKYIENVRRPYYRMRGMPVTKDQAFDIIRRTDNFFSSYIDSIKYCDNFIGCINFDNWLIMKNHSPKGYGWIHADGTVGGNAITQKYPTITEFVFEWFHLLLAFPYLDLVVAVTYWDEIPPEIMGDDNERYLFHTAAYDEKFCEAVEVGIYVHDKTIEILDKHDTLVKYKEYDKLYGNPREKFISTYYEDNNIIQIDREYLIRCIESYGLNATEELSKVPEYVWKGNDL